MNLFMPSDPVERVSPTAPVSEVEAGSALSPDRADRVVKEEAGVSAELKRLAGGSDSPAMSGTIEASETRSSSERSKAPTLPEASTSAESVQPQDNAGSEPHDHAIMDDEAGRVVAGTEKGDGASPPREPMPIAQASEPQQKPTGNKRIAKKNKRRAQMRKEQSAVGLGEAVSGRTTPEKAAPIGKKTSMATTSTASRASARRSGARSPFDYITELEMEVSGSVGEHQDLEADDDDTTKGDA